MIFKSHHCTNKAVIPNGVPEGNGVEGPAVSVELYKRVPHPECSEGWEATKLNKAKQPSV